MSAVCIACLEKTAIEDIQFEQFDFAPLDSDLIPCVNH